MGRPHSSMTPSTMTTFAAVRPEALPLLPCRRYSAPYSTPTHVLLSVDLSLLLVLTDPATLHSRAGFREILMAEWIERHPEHFIFAFSICLQHLPSAIAFSKR